MNDPQDDTRDDDARDPDLAPGTWVTESTGFASVPPRAKSDLGAVCEEEKEEAGSLDENSRHEEEK